jgi:hypothetical protein
MSPYAIDVPEGAIVGSVTGAARYLHVTDTFVKGRLRFIRLLPFAFLEKGHAVKPIPRGLLAGSFATAVMSIPIVTAKRVGFIRAIPPREISENIVEIADGPIPSDPTAVDRMWPIAHVAYGAACGAIFSRFRSLFPESTARAGLVFGGAVWAISYGGYLPVLRFYPTLNRDAEQRILTMTVAHVLFGLSLAYCDRALALRFQDATSNSTTSLVSKRNP